MHEAKYYTRINDLQVKCMLCPHECIISDGKSGNCAVRSVKEGVLFADTYGKLAAIAIDPIEKKPLYHFYPGSSILSIGSVGCNLHCSFCQNSDISQYNDSLKKRLKSVSVKEVIGQMKENSLRLVAYTYNEPVVFFEYILDLARVVLAEGCESVMVTNGYINRNPLKEQIPYISAFNVDLKAYKDSFYRKTTGSSMKPVLDTIELIKRSDKHIEITFLVIPGLNDQKDDFLKMARFISQHFGRKQVLHISRYYPHYKLKIPPTPLATIIELTNIAKQELDFVYPGNTGLNIDSSSYCPGCGNILVERHNYLVKIRGVRDGQCASCGRGINGKFNI